MQNWYVIRTITKEIFLKSLLKTLAKGYYTGGNGGHGVGPTPDALFSQGAMTSSKSHDVVIAVNVSAFSVCFIIELMEK